MPTTPAADDGAPRSTQPGAARAVPEVLARTVRELEQHVASAGWDGPLRLFALVRIAAAMADEPGLAGRLPPEVVRAAEADPDHLTSVEQEGLPETSTLEELLAGIAWPPTVHGAALVVERLVVPPEVEAEMPAEPQEAVRWLGEHPARQDVRIAVAVLRGGVNACALRSRSSDDPAAVAVAPDLVPGLVHALAATLDDEDTSPGAGAAQE